MDAYEISVLLITENNFICCRSNLGFAKYKEQYIIDDEITLNEEGVMDFNSTQNKLFMVHQGSLEELVPCAIPKKMLNMQQYFD